MKFFCRCRVPFLSSTTSGYLKAQQCTRIKEISGKMSNDIFPFSDIKQQPLIVMKREQIMAVHRQRLHRSILISSPSPRSTLNDFSNPFFFLNSSSVVTLTCLFNKSHRVHVLTFIYSIRVRVIVISSRSSPKLLSSARAHLSSTLLFISSSSQHDIVYEIAEFIYSRLIHIQQVDSMIFNLELNEVFRN